MIFKLNRVTQCNVFLNGNSLLGKTEEVTVGPVKYIMADHKAVGMVGVTEFFSGVDKIDFKLKWNSFYNDVLAGIGNPMQFVDIMVRSSVASYDASGLNAEYPLVIYAKVAPKDFPMGAFKQHENVDLESNFAVYYIKIEENGVALFEFDALANVFSVNGVDILATYRSNLGI